MRHSIAPEAGGGGLSVGEQALQAQADLLPYALAGFAMSLPIFVWAGALAPNAAWMCVSFVIFAIGWGGFYAMAGWLRRAQGASPRRRGGVQILGGLVWAGAIAQVAAFAQGAGPYREPLLLATLAASILCVVFAAPWLPSLLIVAPAALAAPVIGLLARSDSRPAATLAWGSAAFALSIGLVVNRSLKRQFAQAVEREALMLQRTQQADAARRTVRRRAKRLDALGDELADRAANDRVVA